MKIRLGELRATIRRLMEFGVDDSLRNDAGLFMGGGISSSRKGVVAPPPGLGSEDTDEEQLDTDDGTQEKSQPAVRVYDRAGGEGRPPRAHGNR